MTRLLTAMAILISLVGCATTEHRAAPTFHPIPGNDDLPFSEAVRAGDFLFLAGQLGTDPKSATPTLVPGGIQPETRQTLENIKTTLERYGATMDDVVKVTCMLADIDEWPAMNEVYIEYFPNKPARSAFAGSGLGFGGRVEIEVIAYMGDK